MHEILSKAGGDLLHYLLTWQKFYLRGEGKPKFLSVTERAVSCSDSDVSTLPQSELIFIFFTFLEVLTEPVFATALIELHLAGEVLPLFTQNFAQIRVTHCVPSSSYILSGVCGALFNSEQE